MSVPVTTYTLYLGWFDDTKDVPNEQKIDDAIKRYELKFGQKPNVCLVTEGLTITHPTIEVKPSRGVRPNCYWVGYEPKGEQQ